MASRKKLLISVVLILAGIISTIFVSIETNSEVIIQGRLVGYNIEVAGDFAYVSNNDGVVVIDKSVYNTPLRIANIPLSNGAFGMDIDDDLLYIAGTSNGLVIVDISVPASPVILGNATIGVAYNVFVTDNRAYTVNTYGELGIVDVSNASNPSVLGIFTVASRGIDVAVVGDIGYFAAPDSGLVVVNVSDPSSLDVIQTLPNTNGAWDICVHEEILYLGRHGGGLNIYNISSPEDPTWLSSFNDGGEVYGVSGDGEYLVLADLQEGAELLDVTDPEDPILLAKYMDAAPHSVYYDGVYAYLGDQDKEFILIDFDGDEPMGYPSRSPNVDWLWAIPIMLFALGISVVVLPVIAAKMKKTQ
ncbi:MAG: hypothetical protein P1Q69_05835 [Candidatus Thorarchaeota archaeon]|nr:hypothetical protein [Candidatus Thorarchaeota archaeon]